MANLDLDQLQAFPILTEEVGGQPSGRTGSIGAPGGTSLGQLIEQNLREILGWRPKANDPRGFVAALNSAFALKEIEGHTIWTWQPRSYTIQADMGAVTGAQASIFARAKAALDQSLPLLDGLGGLLADGDDEDMEATRALVRSAWLELVNELGMVGGPRIQRVESLFTSLLGAAKIADPNRVAGLLGTLRERFGFRREQVNTIPEEQDLTNFLILVDHTVSLRNSWDGLKDFFDRQGDDVFLGTQLVLLSRALVVVAESVQEVYYTMDSVFIGAAERQTIPLDLGADFHLTIAELLGWVEYFASEEGPRLIREGGKDGAREAFTTLVTLRNLVQAAINSLR